MELLPTTWSAAVKRWFCATVPTAITCGLPSLVALSPASVSSAADLLASSLLVGFSLIIIIKIIINLICKAPKQETEAPLFIIHFNAFLSI